MRDEAEPVVRPATDANEARVVAGFPFSGECSRYRAWWERSTRRGATMKRMVVAAVDDVHDRIDQYVRAQRECLRGIHAHVQHLLYLLEDVTLANPYGLPVHGWD